MLQAERPVWLGRVGDWDLKLIGASVAISAIERLKTFLQPGAVDHEKLARQVGIRVTFVASGVLFAVTDGASDKKN